MHASDTPAYDRWARYYDVGEGDRRPHVDFYASLLRPGDRSVLEIGCGTGVVAAALAERIRAAGHEPRVVGLDVSAAMLEVARSRHPSLEWVLADMRVLREEPRLAGRFDLLVCCFNTFQFMPDEAGLAQAFAAARARVEPDGRLAFDLYQPNLPYLRVARRDSLARSVEHQGRTLQIREDACYDEERCVLELGWRLVPADAPDEVLAATGFSLRQFPAADVDRLLAQAGWRVVERYGDLQRSAFNASSTKQVLVCAPA